MLIVIFFFKKTAIIPSIDHIDTDVLGHMTSLGSFKDKPKLIDNLLNERLFKLFTIYVLHLGPKQINPVVYNLKTQY